MRFSIRWILGGMAYVAVAAAAFSRQTWVFADALWAASMLAVVFAALLAVFARGRRQMAAAGFVVASACYLLCLQFGDDAVPTARLLAAAGINANAQIAASYPKTTYSAPPQIVRRRMPVMETKMTDAGPTTTTRYVDEVVTVASPTAQGVPTSPTPVAAAGYYAPTPVYAPPLTVANWMASPRSDLFLSRAGNAVGMMGFGLLGCVVGVVAHKAARRETHGIDSHAAPLVDQINN